MATAITEGRVLHRARLYDWGTTLVGRPLRALHPTLGLRGGSEHAQQLSAVMAAAGFEAIQVEPTGSRAFSLLVGRKP